MPCWTSQPWPHNLNQTASGKPGAVQTARGDIAEVQTAEGKLHLYVAIDRTSKFAFVQLVTKANRVTASAFLMALIEAVLYKIHIVLTDRAISPPLVQGQWRGESSSPSRRATLMVRRRLI